MFIADGWGSRLKEERERIGLTQQAFTHRNTQRAYEQEASCPDLRYLYDVERRGLDARYILTGQRLNDPVDSSATAALSRLWPNLGADNYAALTTLANALDAARSPERESSHRSQAAPGLERIYVENPEELSDFELRRAYLQTDGDPGDPRVEALLTGIERRGLDV